MAIRPHCHATFIGQIVGAIAGIRFRMIDAIQRMFCYIQLVCGAVVDVAVQTYAPEGGNDSLTIIFRVVVTLGDIDDLENYCTERQSATRYIDNIIAHRNEGIDISCTTRDRIDCDSLLEIGGRDLQRQLYPSAM